MRSERIHHVERLKAKRRFHWGRDLAGLPRELGKVVRTPTPCSCALCSSAKRGETPIKQLASNEAWAKIERP